MNEWKESTEDIQIDYNLRWIGEKRLTKIPQAIKMIKSLQRMKTGQLVKRIGRQGNWGETNDD